MNRLSKHEKAELRLIADLTHEATLASEERLARIKKRMQAEQKARKTKSKSRLLKHQ